MQKKKSSFLTIFAIITTITIIVWISASSYFQLRKIDLTSVPPDVLSPLNPNLDKAALDSLEKKRVMTEEEISRFSQQKTRGSNPVINEATKSAEGAASQ